MMAAKESRQSACDHCSLHLCTLNSWKFLDLINGTQNFYLRFTITTLGALRSSQFTIYENQDFCFKHHRVTTFSDAHKSSRLPGKAEAFTLIQGGRVCQEKCICFNALLSSKFYKEFDSMLIILAGIINSMRASGCIYYSVSGTLANLANPWTSFPGSENCCISLPPLPSTFYFDEFPRQYLLIFAWCTYQV